MSVNKFKIPIRDINISGTTINLNVNLDFSPVDNAELIKTKLIDDEIEKAINPIDDYKKVRFFHFCGNLFLSHRKNFFHRI